MGLAVLYTCRFGLSIEQFSGTPDINPASKIPKYSPSAAMNDSKSALDHTALFTDIPPPLSAAFLYSSYQQLQTNFVIMVTKISASLEYKLPSFLELI